MKPTATKDVKEKIIRAAMNVFSVHGFFRASVKKVAEEAGVSKGLIFWYFESKDDLIREVVKRTLPINILNKCLEEGLEGRELLKCIAVSYLNTYSDPVMRGLLLHSLGLGDIYPGIKSDTEYLCDDLLKRVGRQVFGLDSVDVVIKMRTFLGALLCYVLNTPRNITREQYINILLDTIIE
jgi:AcrR family transcriptional regulator